MAASGHGSSAWQGAVVSHSVSHSCKYSKNHATTRSCRHLSVVCRHITTSAMLQCKQATPHASSGIMSDKEEVSPGAMAAMP